MPTAAQKELARRATWTAAHAAAAAARLDPYPVYLTEDEVAGGGGAGVLSVNGLTGAVDLSGVYVDTLAPVEGVPIVTYAHSYGTTGTKTWPARLALRSRAVDTNRSLSGDELYQTALMGMFNGVGGRTAWTPGTKGVVLVEAMINNVRLYGNDAGAIAAYKDMLRCAIYLARASSLVHESSGSYTYNGAGWTDSVLPNDLIGGHGQFNSTVGRTVDITFTGDEIILFAPRFKAGTGAGTIEYLATPGGTLRASVDQSGTSANALPGGAAMVLSGSVPTRLTGFGAGSHTMQARVATASPAFVDGYVLPSTTPPTVLVVKDQLLPVWTGGNNAAPYNLGSDAAVALYKAAIDTVVAEFPAAEVKAVDVAAWSKTTMVHSDGVHPNERGLAAYVEAVIGVLRTLDFRVGLNAS